MTNHETKLTVLNFSGGQQSAALLWMIIEGDIEVDKSKFVALNADPGMENSETYKYIEMMKIECEKAGIELITVPGPNLYNDLIELSETDKTRIDNPPYWTDKDGSPAPLMQKCTKFYKIAPMDRAIRRILDDKFGISKNSRRIGENIVNKFIGFAYDEVERIKPSQQKYIEFSYPLIDMKLTKSDVEDYFKVNGFPIPPRSVCNACFANGTDTLMEMFLSRPQDWEQAVKVDEAVRDLTQIGVNNSVFVSKTLIPLADLATAHFTSPKNHENDYSCDSGYCFT